MTYYVSLLTGDVDVIPGALAVDDMGNTLRFLTARGPHSAEIADIRKSTIVGIETAISSGCEVVVLPEGPYAGTRGTVVSCTNPNAIEVDLEGDAIRLFTAEQLGVWSENRLGHDGHPPKPDAPDVAPTNSL